MKEPQTTCEHEWEELENNQSEKSEILGTNTTPEAIKKLLDRQKEYWAWVIKAHPMSGTSATAGYALKEIENFEKYGDCEP